MRKNKKNKIKVRQFWTRDPASQVHSDEKNDYNRSKFKQEWKDEIEDVLMDSEYDDLEDSF